MNDFAFLLVNYNNSTDTKRCIQSILKQLSTSKIKAEIYIFDNSAKVGSFSKNAKVYGDSKNIGFAAACNFLAAHASITCQNLIFINNDTILGPKFIQNLPQFKASLAGKTALCPLIYNENGKIWFSKGIIHTNICRPETSQVSISSPIPSQFLTGCCLIISAKNWAETGGFDDNYFLYYEDVDWSIRSQNHLKLIVDPGLQITHFSHSSTGHNNGPIQTYFQTRNNLYLAKKLRKLHFNIPYMILISAKRIINLLLFPSPQKKLTLKMLFLAWIDFITNKYGKGSFEQN